MPICRTKPLENQADQFPRFPGICQGFLFRRRIRSGNLFQPVALILRQIAEGRFAFSLPPTQMIKTGPDRDPRKPMFERRLSAKIFERKIDFHKNLLRQVGLLLTALSITTGNLENPGLISIHELFEGGFVSVDAMGNEFRIGYRRRRWLRHRPGNSSTGVPACDLYNLDRRLGPLCSYFSVRQSRLPPAF